MSINSLMCNQCRHKISFSTEYCPSCGVEITEEEKIQQKTKLDLKKFKNYQKLRSEIDQLENKEVELKELNIKKNKYLTQINTLDLEIKENIIELDSLASDRTKIKSGNVFLKNLKKIIFWLRLRQISHKMTNIDSMLTRIKTQKRELQEEFYLVLNELEELQEIQLHTAGKRKILEEIKSEIAQDIDDKRESELKYEIMEIKSELSKREITYDQLNDAMQLVNNAIKTRNLISNEYNNLVLEPDKGNKLLGDANLKGKLTKLRMQSIKINDILDLTHQILETLLHTFEKEYANDFEILVKYLRSYVKENKIKFSNSAQLNRDLDLSKAHILKIKIWLAKYLNREKEMIDVLHKELQESEIELENIITKMVDDYVNQQISTLT